MSSSSSSQSEAARVVPLKDGAKAVRVSRRRNVNGNGNGANGNGTNGNGASVTLEKVAPTTSLVVDKVPSVTTNPDSENVMPTLSAPNDDPIEILLVDDAPSKLLALEAALTDLGQTIVKAESGAEALRQEHID